MAKNNEAYFCSTRYAYWEEARVERVEGLRIALHFFVAAGRD